MFDSSTLLRQRFAALRSTAELFSLRHVKQSHQSLSVRRNVAEPPFFSQDEGAMLTVRVNGVDAYAATADLSQAGLQRALEQAEALAHQIWESINGRNLRENIDPTKGRASLVIEKGADHRVTDVFLRKL